jgi:hypothetical protein
MIDDQIACYPQDPVLKAAGFRPVAFEILVNPNQNVLCQIFRNISSIHIPIAQVVNAPSKGVHDRLPCGVIPLKTALYKFVIA